MLHLPSMVGSLLPTRIQAALRPSSSSSSSSSSSGGLAAVLAAVLQALPTIVLPQLDVTVNVMLYHLLGRDYRADVLGMRASDRFQVCDTEGVTGTKKAGSRRSKDHPFEEHSAVVLRQKLKQKVNVLEQQLQQERATGGILKVIVAFWSILLLVVHFY